MMQTVVQVQSTFTRMLNDWSLLMQMDSQTIITVYANFIFFFFCHFCHFCLYSYRGQEEKVSKIRKGPQRSPAELSAPPSYIFLMKINFSVWHSTCTFWRHNVQKTTHGNIITDHRHKWQDDINSVFAGSVLHEVTSCT